MKQPNSRGNANSSSVSYEELLRRLNSVDEVEKRQVILDIGDNCFTQAYGVLRSHIKTGLEHQALIAMARIDYRSTLDIVVSLLGRGVGNGRIAGYAKTLSCIFGDRLDDLGEEEFLDDLEYFSPLDRFTKGIFVHSIKDCLKLTDIKDPNNYSLRVSMSLFR